MRKVLAAGVMVAACAAQAQTLDLHGIGVSRDVSCKGLDVIVTGNGNQFRLTGDCGQAASVAIYGEGNVLDLDLSGPVLIEINGLSQQLTWSGDEPQIETTGVDHRIRQD